MTRVVVDVKLKPEILDPQGDAIARALPRLGFGGVTSVRQGKRFEIEFSDTSDTSETSEPPDFSEEEVLAKARQIAETLLANPVIEDFEVRVVI